MGKGSVAQCLIRCEVIKLHLWGLKHIIFLTQGRSDKQPTSCIYNSILIQILFNIDAEGNSLQMYRLHYANGKWTNIYIASFKSFNQSMDL